MNIKLLDYDFSVCKVENYMQVDFDSEYCFAGKTDDENSLVCISDCVPDNATECDNGWKAFKIQGILDFSLIGIISKISALLADSEIPVFVVSTYNTDYFLIKKEYTEKAVKILSDAGYQVV